jgi:hypothetical protein
MLMRCFRLSRFQKQSRRLPVLVESQVVQVELPAQVVALEQAQVRVGQAGQQELRQLMCQIAQKSQLYLSRRI